jgi:hypothetical protein
MSSSFLPADKQWFKDFLKDFSEVNFNSDTSARCRCPDPNNQHTNGDKNPSLSVDLSQNGHGPTALLRCRSQECEVEAILEALGKDLSDLYPSRAKEAGALQGCTIEEYAASKNLPVEFLTGDTIGLKESKYWCRVAEEEVPAIWIPYMDEGGAPVATRYRTGLYRPPTGDDTRFRWKKGAKLTLYGRNWLDLAQEKEYVNLVEGESDCHVLWHYNEPAIGVPGAKNWRDEWSVYLDDIPEIRVLVEPDAAGEEMWKAIFGCNRLSQRTVKVVLP